MTIWLLCFSSNSCDNKTTGDYNISISTGFSSCLVANSNHYYFFHNLVGYKGRLSSSFSIIEFGEGTPFFGFFVNCPGTIQIMVEVETFGTDSEITETLI